jgi:hypothetical protein
MNRRNFLVASGSAIMTGLSMKGMNRPVVAINFKIREIPNKDPSKVSSILFEFSQFDIQTQYLNDSDNMEIEVEINTETIDQSKKSYLSFTNGEKIDKSDLKEVNGIDLTKIYIDGLNTSEDSLSGSITIYVRHPDIDEKSYTRRFAVNGDNVPSTVISQYDFRLEDGETPVSDRSPNGNDLFGSYSGVNRTLNGKQAADFSSDSLHCDYSKSYDQPLTFYIVLSIDTIENTFIIHNNTSVDSSRIDWSIRNDDEFFMYPSSYIRGFYPSSNKIYILTAAYHGSNSYMKANGTQVMSGSVSPVNPLKSIVIGSRDSSSNPFRQIDAAIGFVEIHNGVPNNGVDGREKEIADDWGLNI